jgi:hypothetical protein
MITAIVRFKVPEGMTLEEATGMFEGSADKYRGLEGLARKYYLFGEDGTAGGAYLWDSRAAAERLYTDEWKAAIKGRFGSTPTIEYFESPVIVDNTTEAVSAAAE